MVKTGIIFRMFARTLSIFLLAAVLLAGCSQTTATLPPAVPSATTAPTQSTIPPASPTSRPATPAPSATPVPPSPTPAPLALKVNNEGLLLADYEAELLRLQAGLKETGKEMTTQEQAQAVQDELVNQLLLAQGAIQAGYQLSDADLQKRLDALISQSGGAQAFADWLKRSAYTDDSFRRALRRSAAAAWQRDQLTAKVPASAEQVHVRQILVLNEDLANRLYIQLTAGADFATVALQVDPDSGGELGWFPRGYIFLPEIEQAAFSLQPGKFSQIIKTQYGYQIIFLIEKDANRALAADARLALQRKYLANWLKERRSQSQVEILVK